MAKKSFAPINPTIVDDFMAGIDDLRAGLINLEDPHYDDKALTLFLLLRFYANCSMEFYTNETMLCELIGISARLENKSSVMANILKMEEDGLLYISRTPNNKFFRLTLDYDMFMPEKNFVVIYKEEFEQLVREKNRDKLIWLLYAIKRFQHRNTAISFPSMETMINISHISKPTVCKCLQQLEPLFNIYRARIHFYDGTYKDVNYYKSRSEESGIAADTVAAIVKKHYTNVQSITTRE